MVQANFLFKRLFFLLIISLISIDALQAASSSPIPYSKTATAPKTKATLHAIVIGDTNSDLKRQSSADIAEVQNGVHFLARSLNLKPNLTILQGYRARRPDVFETINRLSVNQEEDILLFYFTGHGFRSQNKRSIWPSIHFSTDNQFIELDSIIAQIARKNPRFSLVIADCCNVSSAQMRRVPKNKHIYINNSPRTEINGDLKKLFLKSSGILVISSSSPGEFSCATDLGGLFTMAFLDTFGMRINRPLRNWDDVLEVVKAQTRGIQTPQYQFY